MKKITLTLLASLTLVTACGNGGGGGGSTAGQITPALEEQSADGKYRAILRPFNNSLSGFLPSGFAEISIVGDSMQVKTLLDDDARVPHLQSIHMGTRCPTISDDTNGDGLVDIEESYRASGEVLIPLDNNLESLDQNTVYPMGGGFTYTKAARTSVVEADTRARFNQNLNLGGRVVIIHGVAGGTTVPSTFATRDGLTPQASAPIVCGVLQRL